MGLLTVWTRSLEQSLPQKQHSETHQKATGETGIWPVELQMLEFHILVRAQGPGSACDSSSPSVHTLESDGSDGRPGLNSQSLTSAWLSPVTIGKWGVNQQRFPLPKYEQIQHRKVNNDGQR